ncbi:hypothetical protein [Saccharothrix deserti]|uniref:hypothetical protein n=1 Tax=Saccharothrix deserti TaxID=2593674 RepID=UPI00131E40D1|nr:hypothetical protein [Saccharothrix deserti]
MGQRTLADFLRLDDDLLTVAAEASPPLDETTDAAWVTALSGIEKDRLLRVGRDRADGTAAPVPRQHHPTHRRNTPWANSWTRQRAGAPNDSSGKSPSAPRRRPAAVALLVDLQALADRTSSPGTGATQPSHRRTRTSPGSSPAWHV